MLNHFNVKPVKYIAKIELRYKISEIILKINKGKRWIIRLRILDSIQQESLD